MYVVKDLLSLECLADAQYALDRQVGFDNAARGIGYLDYEPLLDRYHTFLKDEVIVTTLGFSGGDEAKATEALVRQMESGVAAVFIKAMLFDHVSDEVLQKALETQTPVFFFYKAYTENIVTELRNLFVAEAEAEQRRVIVDELRQYRSVSERRKLFNDRTGLMGGCAACAALKPLGQIDPLAVHAVSAAMREAAEREMDIGCFIASYQGIWVLLVASDETHEGMDALMMGLCEGLCRSAGVDLTCGIGNAVALEDVDLTITQALQAVEFPNAPAGPHRWRDAGWAALSGAARESKQLSGQCAHLRGILAAYDSAHGSCLLETVRTFVECDGVVQDAAERLYLHPNSVRNRVVKAASLLGLQDEPERALFAYFAIMFLGVSFAR